mmetsp:Transcript_7789/g.9870  ORF Transcript_7789/g.9870 Transcript_7789/m.9870 type:complete len:258 (-) Transcript_7789:1161-1934(-)
MDGWILERFGSMSNEKSRGNGNKINSDRLQVVLTYAQSLDGSLTAVRGTPLALSSAESFRMTHLLRASLDAILVGVNTIISDDPSLTTRLVDGPNPLPIVLDTNLRIPFDCKLFTDQRCRKPVICCSNTESNMTKVKHLEALGAKFLFVGTKNGRVSLPSVFDTLREAYKDTDAIKSIMVEGGASIITSMLQPDALSYITNIILTMSPMFVGGLRSVQELLPSENRNSNDGKLVYKRWKVDHSTVLGGDVIVCLSPP